MNFYELWEIGQRIELGFDQTGTDKLTKEIMADKTVFTKLKNKFYKLQMPIMDNKSAKLTLKQKIKEQDKKWLISSAGRSIGC